MKGSDLVIGATYRNISSKDFANMDYVYCCESSSEKTKVYYFRNVSNNFVFSVYELDIKHFALIYNPKEDKRLEKRYCILWQDPKTKDEEIVATLNKCGAYLDSIENCLEVLKDMSKDCPQDLFNMKIYEFEGLKKIPLKFHITAEVDEG